MHPDDTEELVTVVTVTYNADALLEETILSVINQSYEYIEYIIIDGASTDGTVDIIKKYEDKINYWISEPDEGIYFAMNKAIDKAKGKWINFMNAGDTFFGLDTVRYVMNHKNENADLVYGNCQIGSRVAKPHDASGYDNLTVICHQTLFVKTMLAKETPFDTRYKISADHDFILKMHKRNKKFHFLDTEIANFLPNGLSETQILRLRIEALAILFANDVPLNDILRSRWYINMFKERSLEEKDHIKRLKKEIKTKEATMQVQEEKIRQLSSLEKAIHEVTTYSVWKQPLQKYKSYKKLLLAYTKIKEQ